VQKCDYCGKEVDLPFQCSFCGFYFCTEHRLPENHDCPNLPTRTPLGQWKARLPKARKGKVKERIKEEGELYFIKENNHKPKTVSRRYGRVRVRLPKVMIVGLVIVFVLFFEYLFMKTCFDTTIYVFVVFVASYLTYTLFILSSKIRVSSDLRLFGLRILAGLTFVAGVLLLAGAFMGYVMSYEQWNNQLYVGVLVFFGTLGLGLMLLASYLMFRFMLKSGVIVYPR